MSEVSRQAGPVRRPARQEVALAGMLEVLACSASDRPTRANQRALHDADVPVGRLLAVSWYLAERDGAEGGDMNTAGCMH